MTLLPRLGLATAVLLLATGCSEDTPPGPMPADGGAESPDIGTPEATTTDEPPFTFTTGRGRTVINCFPDGPRRMMVFDELVATRSVALTGAGVTGDAMLTGRAWLAPLPKRAIGEGGMIDLDAGGTSLADIDAWADRDKLVGSTLEEGQRYTFFVRVNVRPDRTFGDLDIDWNDAGTTGTTAYPFGGKTRSGGC